MRKNPDPKEHTLHDVIYMKSYKREIESLVTESRSEVAFWGQARVGKTAKGRRKISKV